MAKTTHQKIIVIVGPTASGKSDLGIKIAKKFNGEIISTDSRQVYRGMDIGTGKVRQDRTFSGLRPKALSFKPDFYSKGIRHHLIDVASPKKQFTADDFKRLGTKAIEEILAKGKIPIIVGGTGFYVDVLLGRMQIAEVPPNKKLRAKLKKQSAEQLFKQLSTLDFQRSKTIDRHNKRRLIRSIEILMAEKRIRFKTCDFSTKYAMAKSVEKYTIMWIGINPGKERLAKNIKKRLDKRLEPSSAKATTGKQGMIEEVQRLYNDGIGWKRLDNFGLEYRWISRHLKQVKSGKLKIKNFKDSEEYKNLLRDIIRYSKRQITWFKRNKEIHWFTMSPVEGLKNQREINRLLVRFLDG